MIETFGSAVGASSSLPGCNTVIVEALHAWRIPSDNHIRNLLDEVSPKTIYPIFDTLISTWQASTVAQEFVGIAGTHLIALDGTLYFSSDTIHCEACSQRESKGKITYSHTVITPVLVTPGRNQVIALRPEFITPQDGQKKQDCEVNAAKRWLGQYHQYYGNMKATILGDDLYSHQPFCEAVSEQKLHFVLVCKEESHTTLYEFVQYLESIGEVKHLDVRQWAGKKWDTVAYRYANGVPIRDSQDALRVNWCEGQVFNQQGKLIYRNAFISDYEITDENVAMVFQSGRARWKIENENNNTLKTKGYHLEHNFGHGQKHLASLLATLNILAFAVHTLLEFFDEKYQELRTALSSRQKFFEHIRALTVYLCFNSWDHLLSFMLQGLKEPHRLPDTS